jgi:hypothetical protein
MTTTTAETAPEQLAARLAQLERENAARNSAPGTGATFPTWTQYHASDVERMDRLTGQERARWAAERLVPGPRPAGPAREEYDAEGQRLLVGMDVERFIATARAEREAIERKNQETRERRMKESSEAGRRELGLPPISSTGRPEDRRFL